MAKHFGCVRYIYNHFLVARNEYYKQHGKGSNYTLDCRELTKMKKREEVKWLNEVNAQSLQFALKSLDSAFNLFFRKINHFPSFKNRHDKQSFRIPQGLKFLNNGKLSIPKFREGIKIKLHRPVRGRIINASIVRNNSGQFFIFIVTDREVSKYKERAESVGIDLGIKNFCVLSTGEKIAPPKAFYKYKKELIKQQKKFDKSTTEKEKLKYLNRIRKIYRKATNIRQDFLHKLANKLVSENQTILVEDLNVPEIQKNKIVARNMQDCSWGTFLMYLEYKCGWRGRNFVKINKWYPSSKTCHKCGFIKSDLTLDDREWDCILCGSHHDRDINAALNIQAVGLHSMQKSLVDLSKKPTAL